MKFVFCVAFCAVLLTVIVCPVLAINPPGYVTTTFTCSNLYPQRGETVDFRISITSHFTTPGSSLRPLAYSFSRYDNSYPIINWNHDGMWFDLAPGQTADILVGSILIPDNAVIGARYTYSSDVDGYLLKDSGTMIWDPVSGRWVPGPGTFYGRQFVLGSHQYSLTVAPEPSSIIAILLGIGGLGGFALRRRRL